MNSESSIIMERAILDYRMQKLRENLECTLSIHMQNGDVKGKGYGTEAERLAIQYAFEKLGMMAVNADTAVKNQRSQHILDKLGFEFIREEGDFRYYRLEKQDKTQMIITVIRHGKVRY